MKTVGTPAARLTVAGALVLCVAVSQLPRSRPLPVPATAPATDFSALRAFDTVRAIAQAPHPIGTAEHDRVRDYIAAELTRQGLTPQVETGHAEITLGRFHASGDAENIVARLPGTANTRPVMLAAHYDSVPRGPGAGDDGHGVAVLVETLRAIRSGPPLRNDVIFLITDGEERGLLGAQVFMREHPWRSEPGVTLNFEARGTSGSAMMFETSVGNAWLIRALQQTVPQADAASVAFEIYRRMPNNTDLSIFKAGGLAGMNFAFIEHPEYYHTAQDTVAHLDPVSVQEQGRYALSLARWFGNQDLRQLAPRKAGDAVYFPTVLTSLIVYPSAFATWVAVLTLLFATVAAWNWRSFGIPLLLLAIIQLWLVSVAPGASYLIAWPLLGGLLAFALLRSAPQPLAIGWRIAAMSLCALPGFLLVVPLLSTLIVALTLRGATPALAAAALLMLLCLLPQLSFVARGR